jgi:glucose-1-phosphate thymidylyltransferase
VIPPVYIGDNVKIENSVVGPYVSISEGTQIIDSRVINSIVQKHCTLSKAVVENSLIGNFVNFAGKSADLSVGDYSMI